MSVADLEPKVTLGNSKSFDGDLACIDWEVLTDAEYQSFLSSRRSMSEGVTRDMFSSEEAYNAYLERSSMYLRGLMKRFSTTYKDIDLIAALRRMKGRNNDTSEDEAIDAEKEFPDLPPFQKLKPDQSLRQKRKIAMEEYENVSLVPGTDCLFTGLQRSDPLYLPSCANVGLDSNAIVYLTQEELYPEKAECIYKLLSMPLEFVVAEYTFIEVLNVMLRGSKPFVGVKIDNSANNRRTRLMDAYNLFNFLSRFKYAQAEVGPHSYWNVLRLTAAANINPYDARVLLESAAHGVSVLVSEDMAHGQIYDCVRDGVCSPVLVWNVFKHNLQLY